MSNTKPDFQTCCREVAERYNVPEYAASNNASKYTSEAAQLYADRCVEEATRWIPVSERMPEEGTRCLIIEGDGYVGICNYTKISKRKFGFVNEQDEQPAICYPIYYKPIDELPKPTQP